MLVSFFKRLFGGSGSGEGTAPSSGGKVEGAAGGGEPDVEAFVAYVVRALVDVPERVSVKMIDKGGSTLIQVACEKKDIGKVIGKSGKTIAAIRALVNGAGGRLGKKVNVEILD